MQLNNPGLCRHIFKSLQDQVRGAPCELHEADPGVRSCDSGSACGVEVDFLTTGAPCDPFSIQRTKRYHCGNVAEHCDFETCMKGVLEMFEKHNPVVGIMEQVWGFALPTHEGARETWKDRSGAQI